MAGRLASEKPVLPNVADVISTSLPKHGSISGKHATRGADALLAYVDNCQPIILDEATNRRLLKKIDRNVLPWLCGLYVLQYLDKGV